MGNRMELRYVDETGIDGRSPLMVMVGLVADVTRVHRTRLEFETLFQDLAEIPTRQWHFFFVNSVTSARHLKREGQAEQAA